VALYIAVFAVVVIGLLLAWRGLGAHASRAPLPPDVGSLADALRTALDLLEAPDPHPETAAQKARKLAAAISLRLAQAAPTSEAEASATALLAAAADDCGWAARMRESAGYAGNPGLQAGAEALLRHARRCLEAVPPVSEETGLRPSPAAPPVR
jgi:hypothetical protein